MKRSGLVRAHAEKQCNASLVSFRRSRIAKFLCLIFRRSALDLAKTESMKKIVQAASNWQLGRNRLFSYRAFGFDSLQRSSYRHLFPFFVGGKRAILVVYSGAHL